MASKFTSLNTYKRRLDGKAIATVDGDHKEIKIETAWLRREISPQTIDEFLSEYTFDESEYLYNQWLKEKE